MVTENEIVIYLKEINEKLDLLISIIKLSNQNDLLDMKNKIKDDKVSSKIIEYADGLKSYGELAFIVSNELSMAEITVKKKIAELKEIGILKSFKKGKETFYENSGII